MNDTIDIDKIINDHAVIYQNFKITINQQIYDQISGNLFQKALLKYGPPRIGIYLILNRVSGHFYIGSTEHLVRRRLAHCSMLLHKRHRSNKLQELFNRLGKDDFIIFMFIISNRSKSFEIEQFLLDKYSNSDLCCNTAKNAKLAAKGRKMPDWLKEKISASNKNRLRPREETERRSAAMKGRKPSEANRIAIANYNKTKKLSTEHIEKLRAIHIGRKQSQEEIAKRMQTMIRNGNHLNGLKVLEQARKRPVIISGVDYKDMKTAADALKVCTHTIRNRIKSKNPLFKDYQYKVK